MTGKIDMSLDEIIKSNKKNFPRQKRNNAGGNKRPGNKGGAPRNNTSPKKSVGNKPGAKPGGKPNSKPVSKPGGGVLRGRKQGGITRNSRPANFTSGRNLPSYKREAFLGAAPRRFGSSSEATKLIVSNLDFGVTDSDILELFGEFGPLKSAGVHYDRSGRSLGSADLIYERRADAIKAMKQYNGVPLDGREMNIQLATSEIPNSNPIRAGNRLGNSNFNKPRAPANNRNRPGGNRGPAGAKARPQQQQGGNNKKKGGAAGKGGKKPKPAPPTAEELDAQLEEYVKAKVTSSEGA